MTIVNYLLLAVPFVGIALIMLIFELDNWRKDRKHLKPGE